MSRRQRIADEGVYRKELASARVCMPEWQETCEAISQAFNIDHLVLDAEQAALRILKRYRTRIANVVRVKCKKCLAVSYRYVTGDKFPHKLPCSAPAMANAAARYMREVRAIRTQLAVANSASDAVAALAFRAGVRACMFRTMVLDPIVAKQRRAERDHAAAVKQARRDGHKVDHDAPVWRYDDEVAEAKRRNLKRYKNRIYLNLSDKFGISERHVRNIILKKHGN